MLLNNIDEITAYPTGNGTFEVTIHTTDKDKDGNMFSSKIVLSHMYLNLEMSVGLSGDQSIKLVLEGC